MRSHLLSVLLLVAASPTIFCMINAEELGVSSANIDNPSAEFSPAARRLLGLEGNSGDQLQLSTDWCARIVRHVGNYAESYERNVGPDTPLALERGVNQLWTNGGLLYAPPI